MNYKNFNCFRQRGFLQYDIILALVISTALTSLLVLNIYNLMADSYTTFNGADRVFAESNFLVRKIEIDLDKAIQPLGADSHNLTILTSENQTITYTITGNSLLRRINRQSDYPLTKSLTSEKSNYFEYFDLAYNKITTMPLTQPELNNLRFIKINIEQKNQAIVRQYSSVNLLYKYDN